MSYRAFVGNDYTHVRVAYGLIAVNLVQTILLGLILLNQEISMKRPINEFMLEELKQWKDNVVHCRQAYKVNQDRLNFIYKVINKRGRDHMITKGEIKRCKLDPIQP